MNTSGKLLILLSLTFVLFAGCIGGEQQDYITEGQTTPLEQAPAEPAEPEPVAPVEEIMCEPSYEYSELPSEAVIGDVLTFSVTSTCAEGKIVGLNIDEKQESGGMISKNDPVTYNFIIALETEGTKSITLWSDNESVYSTTVEVDQIGSTDTSGNKNDPASVKEWIATSFEAEGPVKVKSIGAYMRRLYSQTMQHSMVVAQIRADNNGNPSDNITAESTIPITDTTMSENWIYFNFPEALTLAPGKYWVVFLVTQETQDQIVSDVVNVHYTFGGDTSVPGDGTNKQMKLEWDNSQRKFVKTDWQNVPYERTYSVVVSSETH